MNAAVLLSTALLASTAGGLLWKLEAKQRKKHAIAQHLQTLLQLRALTDAEGAQAAQLEAAQRSGLQRGPAWLRHPPTWRAMVKIVMAASIAALPVMLMGWWLAGLCAWLGVIATGALWAWRRWRQLRQKVLLQLPSFIDAMVRMVILGHASQAAFLQAASTVKAPLQGTLEQAVAFAKAGMPVDQALITASQHWGLQDFHLLAAVMQIGTRFGGRLDALLGRIAGFMRDREAAVQELHALSTEVRLSAWLLGLLPVVVGGLIVVSNVHYFLNTLADPGGRTMLLVALALQAAGALLLYRVARLD